MVGTARRYADKEGGEAVPILQKTAATADQHEAPPRSEGRDPRTFSGAAAEGGSFIGKGSGGRLGAGDRPHGGGEDQTAEGMVASYNKKPLLPEAVIKGLLFGMVNGILLPPLLVSFAAMIFRDPAFAPHLPRLFMLVIFSGAVHMACFGVLSSLKFAVGSVQDAGLIFLSAIASTVVVFSREQGLDEAAMLSTVCFMLCMCTGLLGLALVVLARLRLASVVQYLPMPVIGGYLAFIGWFCGQAGLAFASGLDIRCVADLGALFNLKAFLLVLPAIMAGVVMYLCLRRFPSPATLPLLMVAFLGTFFASLWATGTSIDDARSAGWVSAGSPKLSLICAWDYFSFSEVRWGAFARVVPNLLAMIVVVAFSSCLDIAAIEMAMGKPLDFNAELQTVGWSNVVAGLFGGFTGSYIFSQTIFNLRAGVETRAASAMSTVMLVAVAASPVNVVSFLPKCFFGALLVLIAVDLMVEWLWKARLRMMAAEYLVCLATFAAMQAWGVEMGMLAGLVLAALGFTVTYAQVPTVMTARVKSSTVMRTFEERVILKAHQEQTVVLELEGYIFFGSAVKILSDVKDRIVWGTDQPRTPSVGGVYGSIRDRSDYASLTTGNPQRKQEEEEEVGIATFSRSSRSSLGGGGGGAYAAVANPWGEVFSPVFNRSGVIYQSSAAMTPGASRSQSWREHRSISFQEQMPQKQLKQQQEGLVSPQGTSPVKPLAKTWPEGGTRNTETENASGSGWGRPFKRSSRLIGQNQGRQEDEEEQIMDSSRIGNSDNRLGVRGGSSGSTGAVLDSRTIFGAMEEGEGDVSSGGAAAATAEAAESGGNPTPGVGIRRPRRASLGDESRTGEGAVQAYMSLWASSGSFADNQCPTGNIGGSSSGSFGRVARSSSVSLLPASQQRTRRVILDFSNVVGVDATAARSCFLMLKMVLKASGADVVFSGVTHSIQALLRSHGVITDDDPLFNSLDTALEWSEERMLEERKDEVLLRLASEGSGRATAGLCPSPFSLQRTYFGGTVPRVITPSAPSQVLEREAQAWARGTGGRRRAENEGDSDNDDEEREEDRSVLSSAEEAAVFLGDHEDYYARAGTLRRRSFGNAWTSAQAGDNPLFVGDVGSLQSILEDYLEVDRYQAPESVRGVLGEAKSFFREEHVLAGAVLADSGSAISSSSSPEKIYFIGSGSVELQIPGEFGHRRLQKVCAGGTFGEVGFFLRTPQSFRAVAREPCHLHTLDRVGMAAMQRENPGLCVLVQKAMMKSICLAASLSIESAHLGPADHDRSGRLGKIDEEH